MATIESMPDAEKQVPAAEKTIHNADDKDRHASVSSSNSGKQAQQASPSALDWDGPDDPENPLNWSPLKKGFHTGASAAFGFAVTCGSSLITPGSFEIAQEFHVSVTAAILTLSLFSFGLGFGPVISAPISETRGRQVVYRLTSVTYMLFILGAGFSKTFGSLLVCRFFAGALGSAALAIGAAPFLGPAFGPVIGGFAAEFKGWRWTQWCTIFIAIAATILVWCMSETEDQDVVDHHTSATNKDALHRANRPFIQLVQWRRLQHHVLLLRGISIRFRVSLSPINLAIWLVVLSVLELVSLAANIMAITIDRKYYYPRYLKAKAQGKERIDPEYRLLAAQIGSIFIPISIFIGGALYLIDVYGPLTGASAIAANGIMRYTLGGVFPLFVVQMYENLGIGWASSVFAFITLIMVPIPFVFYFYGPRVRKMSKLAPVLDG
ncbi:hypothetical protein MRB53_040790 [Persea americana]|nr:hypothetical protein MRB53_040790 [Persea americana]